MTNAFMLGEKREAPAGGLSRAGPTLGSAAIDRGQRVTGMADVRKQSSKGSGAVQAGSLTSWRTKSINKRVARQ